MQQYHDLLRQILSGGDERPDRTNTGTIGLFARQLRFDLEYGFPLMTTKKMALLSIIYELLWLLRGDRNIKYLVDHGVNIWNEWPFKYYLQSLGLPVPANGSEEWKSGIAEFARRIKTDDDFAAEYGDLGPVYGHQWRHWPDGKGGEIDQIQRAIDTLRNNPTSRRILVSAWNVADIDEMAISGLPPCHLLFQFDVRNGKLNCALTQRSADMFLGVPFNIASYALLVMMMAQVTGLKPGELVINLGDAHVYLNHLDQVHEQLSRTPKQLPTMQLNPDVKDIFEFTYEDIILEGYDPDGAIRAPIAV